MKKVKNKMVRIEIKDGEKNEMELILSACKIKQINEYLFSDTAQSMDTEDCSFPLS
jgi:hypothetical protein